MTAPTAAERQSNRRARTAAGYRYLGKFIRQESLKLVEPHLLTAEQVDAAIAATPVAQEQEERE